MDFAKAANCKFTASRVLERRVLFPFFAIKNSNNIAGSVCGQMFSSKKDCSSSSSPTRTSTDGLNHLRNINHRFVYPTKVHLLVNRESQVSASFILYVFLFLILKSPSDAYCHGHIKGYVYVSPRPGEKHAKNRNASPSHLYTGSFQIISHPKDANC